MIKKVVVSGIIVSSLEWYDYALYGLLASIISKQFFPATDSFTALIATFGIFAAGFIMRPIGALLFGYIGDKFGRRNSFVASILLMALPTACIGLLPTYNDIGILAPLLLTLLRLLQGLSLGGASTGSMAFIVEHAPSNRRGLIGSTTMLSMVIGILMGAAISSLISYLCTAEQFLEFGWRIPFLIGIIAAAAGLYIKKNIPESPVYLEAKKEDALSSRPFYDLIRYKFPELLQVIGIILSLTIPYYTITVFLITLMEMLGHSRSQALLMNTISMVVLLIFILISGTLSDYIGRKRTLVIGAIAYLIATIPIFWLMCLPGFIPALIGYMLMAALLGLYIGPLPAVLVEIFPTSIRYTGVSFGYNFCISLFGGTAPLVSTAMIHIIKDNPELSALSIKFLGSANAFPAAYITLAAVVTLITLYFYKDRYKEPLY